ncbi:hypothetical protein V6Z11_A11G233400 [Gossypium hirsutum]
MSSDLLLRPSDCLSSKVHYPFGLEPLKHKTHRQETVMVNSKLIPPVPFPGVKKKLNVVSQYVQQIVNLLI